MTSHRSTREKVSAEADATKPQLEGFGNALKEFSNGTDTLQVEGLYGAPSYHGSHDIVNPKEECSSGPVYLSHFYCDNATLLPEQTARSGTEEIPVSISNSMSENEAFSLNLDDRNCSQFIDNDDEYDQMEEEDVQGRDESNLTDSDPFVNQFLHIGIPATGLKDVSRVKKDLHHDRIPKKKSVMEGLQRAVSSVRIADRRRPLCQTPTVSASSSSVHVSSESRCRSGLRRVVSFNKAKPSELPGGARKQEPRPSVSSIASIHEANSKVRSASNTGAGLTLSSDVALTHSSSNNTGVGDASQISEPSIQVSDPQERGLLQRYRETNAQKPSQRQSLRSIGRILTLKNQTGDRLQDSHSGESADVASGMKDRPRPVRAPTHQTKKGKGRISLQQVGRSLSLTRRKAYTSDNNKNSDRMKPTDRDAVQNSLESRRSSLQRIGRVMSVSNKPWNKKGTPELQPRVALGSSRSQFEDIKHHVHGISDALQEGPTTSTDAGIMPDAMNTSKLSEPSSLQGREKTDKETSDSNLRDEARLKVKAVGRMFSFAKPHANRGRIAQRADEQSQERRFIRTHSAPPRSPRFRKHPESHMSVGGNAGKFYYAEITSGQVKKSGLLQGKTHITVPIIVMGDYAGAGSRSRWHTDVFVLPHNAVRMECLDLYDILVSMAQSRRDTDITVDDISNLEEWWKTANDFFKFYFEIERRVLFPWVESAGSQDWDVQTALDKMRGMKHKLQEHLAGIERIWNEKTFKTEGEMFALVYKAVDNFVPRLMNYFSDQEVLLPAIVQSYYKSDERLRIDREVARLLVGDEARKNIADTNHQLVLLIRWMTSAKQVRAWTGRNLNSWARNMYPRWYSLFESQHLRIVKTFRSRCKQLASKGH